MSAALDYAKLYSDGLPDPAPRWAPFPKYYFVGANNDPEQIPIEGLIEAIEAATEHVHVSFYIWLDDGNGGRVADAISAAARRGEHRGEARESRDNCRDDCASLNFRVRRSSGASERYVTNVPNFVNNRMNVPKKSFCARRTSWGGARRGSRWEPNSGLWGNCAPPD